MRTTTRQGRNTTPSDPDMAVAATDIIAGESSDKGAGAGVGVIDEERTHAQQQLRFAWGYQFENLYGIS